jgi:hypothetical protein
MRRSNGLHGDVLWTDFSISAKPRKSLAFQCERLSATALLERARDSVAWVA